MTVRRRLLPSLNALRSFEAVARHESFTKAAAELNVTQGAASRQVRALEEFLNLPLFVRTTRRIELTDEGRYYARLIHEALDRLEAGTMELLANRAGGGVLTIGTLPTFGTRWLIPRLASFQSQYPDIELHLVSSDGPLDFVEQRLDAAIRFGTGQWPDTVAERLMPEEVLMVCSPALIGGAHPPTSVAALRHHRLIQHSTRADAWPLWFSEVGVNPAGFQWGPSLEHFYMVIQAAVAGLGLALLPKLLIEDELASGTLVAPFDATISGPGAYYVVCPTSKADLPRIRALRRWILAEAGVGESR